MNGRTGLELIPTPAKILAAMVFLAVALGISWLFNSQHMAAGFGPVIAAAMAAITAGFILLAGYVYGDSSRRGMPAVAWTALALLVPNGLGFVIYFLLRKPLVHPCSRCGNGVSQDDAFCPRCGQPQRTAAA